MKKGLISIILAVVLCVVPLTACGESSASSATTSQAADEYTTETASQTETPNIPATQMATEKPTQTETQKSEYLGIVANGDSVISDSDVSALCEEYGLTYESFAGYSIEYVDDPQNIYVSAYSMALDCSTIIFLAKGSSDTAQTISQQNPDITVIITDTAKAVVPIIEKQYSIYEALTNFSEDRAWVSYQDENNKFHYGFIDTNGMLVWSINVSELGEKWGINYPKLITEPFSDGISCIHPDNGSEYSDSIAGMIIINDIGEIQFDSRNAPEGTLYYYLGYGDGTILTIRHTADFSTNKKYICEMNHNGEIVYEKELSDDFSITGDRGYLALGGHVSDDYAYYGEDIFKGTQHKEGPMIYNRKTHEFFIAAIHGSFYIGFRFCDSFYDGYAVVCGPSLSSDHSCYYIPASCLYSENAWESYDLENAYIGSFNPDCIAEGLINSESGIFNYEGVQIATYPENWDIEEADAFSGGYAPLVLIGADGDTYITVVDTNGNAQYDPIKIDSFASPAWHGYTSVMISGERVLLDPQGKKTDKTELSKIGKNYTIGWESSNPGGSSFTMLYGTVRCGFSRQYDSKLKKYVSYTELGGKTIDTIYLVSNYNEIARQ